MKLNARVVMKPIIAGRYGLAHLVGKIVHATPIFDDHPYRYVTNKSKQGNMLFEVIYWRKEWLERL